METILNKREACRFGNSGTVSKKIKNWGSLNYFKLGGLKIPKKLLRFNPFILMHGGINKHAAVRF